MKKPVEKTLVIEIRYWDCGNPEHHHRTALIASRCIEKAAARKSRAPIAVRRNEWIQVARAALLGATLRDAAALVGRSSNRAEEYLRRIRRAVRELDPAVEHTREFEAGDGLIGMRKHQHWWLARLKELENNWQRATQPTP